MARNSILRRFLGLSLAFLLLVCPLIARAHAAGSSEIDYLAFSVSFPAVSDAAGWRAMALRAGDSVPLVAAASS